MSSTMYNAPSTPIASAKKRQKTNKELQQQENSQRVVNSPLRNMSVNVVPTGRYSYHTHSHEENVIFSPTGTFKYEEDVYMTSNYQSSTLSDSSVDSVKSEDQESDIKSEEEDEEDFNSYLFMSGLPAYSTVRHTNLISISPNMFLSKQTLVLDLDETLVHCSVDPVESCDFVFPVTFNEVNYQVHVKKRPYVDYFLESVSKHFEVIVFTASQKIYADKLLDLLDPQKKIFAHRLFRDSCLGVCGNFVKDLRVVNRDLSKTVLVDNSPHAYAYHVDNGIPIESWFDDESDTELLKLIGFLRRLKGASDVRHIIRDHFKTYKLVENAGYNFSVRNKR